MKSLESVDAGRSKSSPVDHVETEVKDVQGIIR